MISLPGIKLTQKGHAIYLTTVTVGKLKEWDDQGFMHRDIWRREEDPQGYQRPLDTDRYEKIAKYIAGELQIEETLLPTTILLNLRQPGVVDFKPLQAAREGETIVLGTIRIDEGAGHFWQVDGQHRIKGLIEAYKAAENKDRKKFEEIRNYPIPLTIMEGLDRPEEAIQFTVINSTQKKVDPSLVLRILHKRWRDKGEKLDFFLKGKSWRLHAIEVCDLLNTDLQGPWFDRIAAPGEKRRGGKVISEQNFVNTLETIYPKEPFRNQNELVKKFLPPYWKAVQSLWKECTDNPQKYSLQRSNGAYVLHWLFPFVYFKSLSADAPGLATFTRILKPISKQFKPKFWERGGEAKQYTSKGSQKELVDLMIASTFPGRKGLRLQKLPSRLKGKKEARIWELTLKRMPLRLFHLFTDQRVKDIDSGATGVYVLYSFERHKFYVGRTEKGDLKTRLETHLLNRERKFDIFNYWLCKDPFEAHDFECALYHILPDDLKENRDHPTTLDGRKCPFD